MKNFIETIVNHRSLLENDWCNVYDIKGLDLSLWGQNELENEINYILDEYE